MKKKIGIIMFVVILIAAIGMSSRLIETNPAGYYKIKQVLWKGDLIPRDNPGTYWQGFSDIETYELAKEVYFSKDTKDGGNDNVAERVLFPDGYADINFAGMYELSLDDDVQISLHIKYNTDEQVAYMVQQQIIEALKNTGTLMSTEEAYSYRRAEFVQLAREQALNGLYRSKVTTFETIVNGKKTIIKRYSVATDSLGNPIIMKESLLAEYKIKLPQYNIKDMDFDPKLEGLIEGRKDAQKSIQDAITATAKGEADIAAERATQEIEKIKEVTIAEKKKAVAVLNAQREKEVAIERKLQAAEEKAATILKAEAKKQELLIADGLSDLAKYKIDANVKSKIGVAEALATWVGPKIVMSGGSSSDSGGLENVLMVQMMMKLAEEQTE